MHPLLQSSPNSSNEKGNEASKHSALGAWDDEIFEKAKVLFLGGMSARQISERFGMSRNSVLGKVAQGIRDDVLAGKLGRSVRAIRDQRCLLGLLYKRGGPRHAKPSLPKAGITITRDALPAYYAIGWRVSWFEGNSVGIEWRHSDAPRFTVVCPSSAMI